MEWCFWCVKRSAEENPLFAYSHSLCLLLCQSSDTEEVLAPGRRASLSDLGSVDDIEALSVRQLKEILARNFVNYKGCCEKWELMERVTRLYHDQKNLQDMGKEFDVIGPTIGRGLRYLYFILFG